MTRWLILSVFALLLALMLGGCSYWPNTQIEPPPDDQRTPQGGQTNPPTDTPPQNPPPDNPPPTLPGDAKIGLVYDWIAWAPVDSRENRGFPKPTIEKGHVGVFTERLDLLRTVRPDGSLWSHPHGNPHLKGSPMKFTMLRELRTLPHLARLADLHEFREAVRLHISEFGEPPVIYTGSIRLNPEITISDVEDYARDLHSCGIERIVIDSAANAPPGSIDWDAITLLQKEFNFRIGCEPWPSEGLPSANLDIWVLDVTADDRRLRAGKVKYPPGEVVHMHTNFDLDRAIEQLSRGESIAINCRGLERQNLTVEDLKSAARRRAADRQE